MGEGPKVQTKFVTHKAMVSGLKPIVVLNKMDRADSARTEEVKKEEREIIINNERELVMAYTQLFDFTLIIFRWKRRSLIYLHLSMLQMNNSITLLYTPQDVKVS